MVRRIGRRKLSVRNLCTSDSSGAVMICHEHRRFLQVWLISHKTEQAVSNMLPYWLSLEYWEANMYVNSRRKQQKCYHISTMMHTLGNKFSMATINLILTTLFFCAFLALCSLFFAKLSLLRNPQRESFCTLSPSTQNFLLELTTTFFSDPGTRRSDFANCDLYSEGWREIWLQRKSKNCGVMRILKVICKSSKSWMLH